MNNTKKEARFEIRWDEEQKSLFERASRLSGFSSLAGFITSVVQKHAEEVIKDHEQILASERDRRIFFDAIMSEHEPNEELKKAAKAYKKLING